MNAFSTTSHCVHVDIRLRLHHEESDDDALILTFDQNDTCVQRLKQEVKSYLCMSMFLENKTINQQQFPTQISTLTIPALLDSFCMIPTTKIMKEEEENQTDEEYDVSDMGDDEDEMMRNNNQEEIKDAFFTPLLIRVHVTNDISNKKEIKMASMLAQFQFHVYHARPSHWIPTCVPMTLKEMGTCHSLPHEEDEGRWESLEEVDNDDINGIKNNKQNLFRLCTMKRHFYYNNTSSGQIIGMNGFFLLHGQPGTGKTSLCSSVAHESSIRLDVDGHGILIDVHMEKLCVRYFGESASLIARLFRQVCCLNDKLPFVVMLLDEVESIAMNRKLGVNENGEGNGDECVGDSIRIVNAVLCGLDTLGHKKNIIVLATSNFVRGIDQAVIDRVDLLLHVRVPSCNVVLCRLLHRCFEQLKEMNMIQIQNHHEIKFTNEKNNDMMNTICDYIKGVSPRRICKLVMHACCITSSPNLSAVLEKLVVISAHWKHDNNKKEGDG